METVNTKKEGYQEPNIETNIAATSSNSTINTDNSRNNTQNDNRHTEIREFDGEDIDSHIFHNPTTSTTLDRGENEILEEIYATDHSVLYEDDDVEDDLIPNFWKNPSIIGKYLVTRLTSLAHIHSISMENINPFPELFKMTFRNWVYFFMGYSAWLTAAWAFFCVSVSMAPMGKLFDKETHDMSWGLSLVLFIRSGGAIISGYFTDKYGRKYPYIVCLFLFFICQLCTPWAKSYNQWLGIRSISGVAMGGIYGPASCTAIEDAPVKARSFLSGLFFSAYSMGFIWAIVFNRAFMNVNYEQPWRIQFWFSCFLPLVLIGIRLLLPETQYFTKVLKAKKLMARDEIIANGGQQLPKKTFKDKWHNTCNAIKKYWLLFGYLVLLLVGPNYLTHASQDLFPTMLTSQLGFSEDAKTVAVVVVNLGAIAGGLIFGQLMEITGRRLGLLIATIMGGCFTYPAFLLRTNSAILGAGFMLYFSVLGVWGVLPIHLSELSPPDARALVSGLAYQLGNLASAASTTIETQLANKYPYARDPITGAVTKEDYAKVMAILTGAAFIFTFGFVFIGHEKFHRDLSSPKVKKYIAKVNELEEKGEYELTLQQPYKDETANEVELYAPNMAKSDSAWSGQSSKKCSDEQIEDAGMKS
ncbi:related to Carboxylic acid transporter protein homolog [Saccharomycodes ludwigii]|uniref:Related to Carboxylic acid transporter protein homolog n=1 Tax=Saccharomycodes ludwigii TaxID=36035 RepID=A0A376BAJ6_9ASCO|nr:related to Carboxylic acid transporter protein homolog [Saccharomycodes ludwigii]